MGAWMVIFPARVNHTGMAAEVVVVACGLFLAFVGGGALLTTLRARLFLFYDRIEVQGAISSRTLSRDEIKGWRINAQGGWFGIVPRDDHHPIVKVPQAMKLDEAFYDWLDRFPSLDELNRQAAEEELRQDPNLGVTSDDRLRTLSRWKRIAWWLNLIGLVAGLWGIEFPRPYALCILILVALPIAALVAVAVSNGLLRIDQYRNDPHPTAAGLFFLPPCALAFRALKDVYLVQWTDALLLTIVVAIAFDLAMIKADAMLAKKRGSLAGIGLFALFYGWGAGLEANVLFDHSSPVSFQASVSAKKTDTYKGVHYKLVLSAWGPRPQGSTIDVSGEVYKAIEPGDFAIMHVRRGALGVAWYGVFSFRRRDP